MSTTAGAPATRPEFAGSPPRRAPYAADPARSRGRLIAEPPSPTRTAFQRDRDRIIHSAGFRRLAHKTQVFVPHEGDHYRTRLTHTIEVAQIARALARGLGLDDDLAEAIALAHDLGHPPFGHAGEEALDAAMAAHGGFDHNAQTLRVVTRLERRYAAFDGLNLCWETLEGLVKHNGPLLDRNGQPIGRGVPVAILEYDAAHGLELASFPSAEAQAAGLADDIAYDAHDIDDGLRAGVLDLDRLRVIPYFAERVAAIEARHPGLEPPRLVHELVRRLITDLIEDAIGESRRRLAAAGLADPQAVRRLGAPVIGFSPAMAATEAAIKALLMRDFYRHPRPMAIRDTAAAVIGDLFGRFHADPGALPPEWAVRAKTVSADRYARLVCDYIAGMTDRFALNEHRRLFDATPDLG